VLVSSRAMGKNGGFDDTYVVDVKKGRSYKIASFCHEGLTTYCDSDSDATVVRAFINSGGQAAALIHSEGGGVADVRRFEVRGFDSHGKTMLLDYGRGGEIAASSLKLQGNLVTWTHSGVERAGRVGRSRCQRLRADRDLAPAKRVKLVRRRAMGGGSELVGCILPRGSVNLIEYAEPGYVSRFSVRQVAGHHVLVGTYDANQIGDHRQTYVFDLRRAAEYAVAESCGPPDSSCGTQDTADAAFVNATGQAAALLHGVYTDEVTVVGFTSRGERMVLDSGTKPEIPASSLALDEHEVTWTHSGAPKSATLSG
jgi:hypothetical protein